MTVNTNTRICTYPGCHKLCVAKTDRCPPHGGVVIDKTRGNEKRLKADNPSNVIELAKKRAKKLVETDIVLSIRAAIAKMSFATSWRNNTGMLLDRTGRPVKFGLCDGSSDLIGITEVVITADMVGKKIGRFTAIEVKQPGKAPTDDQNRFIDVVKARGGAATWVTSVDDVAPWLEKAKVMAE